MTRDDAGMRIDAVEPGVVGWLRHDRRNWFVMAVAGWEFATLAFPRERHGWLPAWWEPWTRYFWRWREHRWQRLGLWLLLGWLTEHVFGEGRCPHGTTLECVEGSS